MTNLNTHVISALIIVLFSTQLGAQNNTFSLEDCITYAWKNSTDISRANNSVKSERAYLDQSKAALFPNLILNVNQNASSANSFMGSENEGNWNREFKSGLNVTLGSSITLYNGAKLKNTITQNKTNLVAAETDIQTQKELISLNILTAYINVLLAKENVENSAAQLKSTEKQLEYAQVRKTAGIISKADYLNIQSQSATEKAAFVAAQSDLRLNRVFLMQLMNMPVDDAFNIREPDLETLLNKTTEPDANKIYNIALGIRPEIKSAEFELESARTGIKIARADGLPTLSLSGSLGTSYSNGLSEINLNEQLTNQISPAVGLSLSIPIFQRKQVKNQVSQATIQADNYRYNLIDIKNNLRKAIEQAAIDAQNASMTFQALQEQYQAEQESHRLAEEIFAQGLINSVDYLTSKNNLVSAEKNLTQAKYNVILQNKIIDYYLGQPITL